MGRHTSDGDYEIIIGDMFEVESWDLDGQQEWLTTIADGSHGGGCAVFDFDLDGIMEIVIPDLHDFKILSGIDGALLASLPGFGTAGAAEFPIVADVDADGSAEIIVIANQFGTGVTPAPIWVVGHRTHGWQGARPMFNSPVYDIVDINDDMTVPTAPEPSWWNDYGHRTQLPLGFSDVYAADLRLDIADVCLNCMKDEVHIAMTVSNWGDPQSPPVPAHTPIEILAQSDGPVIGTVEIGQSLAAGQSIIVPPVVVPLSAFTDLQQLTATINPPFNVHQCNTDGNTDTWTNPLTCPVLTPP